MRANVPAGLLGLLVAAGTWAPCYAEMVGRAAGPVEVSSRVLSERSDDSENAAPCKADSDLSGLFAGMARAGAALPADAVCGPNGLTCREAVSDARGAIATYQAERAALCERVAALLDKVTTYREREVPLLERIIATADARAATMEAAWREAMARPVEVRRSRWMDFLQIGLGGFAAGYIAHDALGGQ